MREDNMTTALIPALQSTSLSAGNLDAYIRQINGIPVLTAEEDTSDPLEAISKQSFAPDEKPLPIDRLEGVGFKIQAISWSEIPEQSLAVINSQVLREGDGIEGYQINRINPDDIVLQRGGKAYRLEFRSTGSP